MSTTNNTEGGNHENIPDISKITLGGVVFGQEAGCEVGFLSLGYLGASLGEPTFVEFLHPLEAENEKVLRAFLAYCKGKYGVENIGAENGVFYGKEVYIGGKSATMTAEEYKIARESLKEIV
ncbi:hypothetical protein K8R14_04045 [bacterium]|nr:hypothetical protein [bacterium]